jgi:predicted nuclease of predicted toxin-antitoxin system
MFQTELADLLRKSGHDVIRAEEVDQSRANDADIMARIIKEGRTLITLDEHFGDWAILPLDRHPGVIRLKIHPPVTVDLAKRLLSFLSHHEQSELTNRLIILGHQRERWITTSA